ncbi:MAG: energy transducer TonB [Terracidiphilus sp.]|jgi:TonB family protein
MDKTCFELLPNRWRRAGARLMQAAVLALMVALTMPACAADARAIKLRTAPHYPEIAKRMRVSGLVRLTVTVDAEGSVTDVKPLSGNGLLSAAAEEAVRTWRFEPGPSASTVEVTVNFSL